MSTIIDFQKWINEKNEQEVFSEIDNIKSFNDETIRIMFKYIFKCIITSKHTTLTIFECIKSLDETTANLSKTIANISETQNQHIKLVGDIVKKLSNS